MKEPVQRSPCEGARVKEPVRRSPCEGARAKEPCEGARAYYGRPWPMANGFQQFEFLDLAHFFPKVLESFQVLINCR